jgi:hypothetical protein
MESSITKVHQRPDEAVGIERRENEPTIVKPDLVRHAHALRERGFDVEALDDLRIQAHARSCRATPG